MSSCYLLYNTQWHENVWYGKDNEPIKYLKSSTSILITGIVNQLIFYYNSEYIFWTENNMRILKAFFRTILYTNYHENILFIKTN